MHQLCEQVHVALPFRRPAPTQFLPLAVEADDLLVHEQRQDDANRPIGQEMGELWPQRGEGTGLDLEQLLAADDVDPVAVDGLLEEVSRLRVMLLQGCMQRRLPQRPDGHRSTVPAARCLHRQLEGGGSGVRVTSRPARDCLTSGAPIGCTCSSQWPMRAPSRVAWTRGALKGGEVGSYYNDELRHRQHTGDVGNSVLANIHTGGHGRNWKAFRLPVALILLGVPLTYFGPLPGLGMLLVLGGVLALPMVALSALLKN